MASMFRKPGEDTSSDPDHVTGDDGDASESQRSKVKGSGSNHPEESKALSPPQSRLAQPTPSRILSVSNLSQYHRDGLLYLSMAEKECKAAAAAELNKTREPDDHLSDDHPEVRELTTRIFTPVAQEWAAKNGLPAELVGEDGPAIRATLMTGLQEYFSQAALWAVRARQLSPASTVISTDVVGFGPFPRGSPLSPIQEASSAPLLVSGFNRSPFKLDSPYKNEYQEISALGKGGYGQVFRVRSHLDKQEYAIKKILISSQRVKKYLQADQIDGLLAEVQTLAKLSHNNIVRYYHAWIEHGPPAVHSEIVGASEGQSGVPRLLPEPETQEADVRYDFTNSLSIRDLKVTSEDEGDGGALLDFGNTLEEETYDDNVVFEDSSMRQSQDPAVDSAHARRESHITTTSNITLQTSILSVAEEEDDPEVEDIPRAAEEIGFSLSRADLSGRKAIASEPAQAEYFGQDITLFIKMSLHPMTLATFLSTELSKEPCTTGGYRHCFHQQPSVGILAAILDGIDYLHSQRIVHRDIKPANIFLSIHEDKAPALEGCVNVMGCSECSHLDSSKRIYVTPCIGDFGLIAELKEPLQNSEFDTEVPLFEPSRLSVLHQKPVGTMFYRPFAMPQKEPIICPKLDVYSLGVIALEMIHRFGTKSERATVLSKLKQGILTSDLEHHPMAKGIKSMVCEDRDKRWDCGAVYVWLAQMQGKGKGTS